MIGDVARQFAQIEGDLVAESEDEADEGNQQSGKDE